MQLSSLTLSTLLLLSLLSGPHAAFVQAQNETADSSSYDFVIVGGGTAGCVVAARLCEAFPEHSFALVEQGTPRTPEQDLAVTAARLMGDMFGPNVVPGVTRLHNSQPNPALLGRVQAFVEATTLGGSSNIAAAWETPVASTIEQYNIPGLDTVTAGPILARVETKVQPQVPPLDLQVPYTAELLEAFAQANFTVLDEQAPYPYEATQGDTIYINRIVMDDQGRRRSAYVSYLQDAMDGPCRANLNLIQDATVTKLMLSESMVTGIEYKPTSDTNATTSLMQIHANHEVFVTAGPFGSPRLLQLSGIGPADVLPSRGVETVHIDLPVGQRTFARPLGAVLAMYTGLPLLDYSNASIYLSDEARQRFLNGQGGPLGQGITNTQGKMGYLGYHSEFFGDLFAPNQPLVGSVCFLNPTSTGNLTIVSANPDTELEFHSNLLSDPQDLADMVECVEKLSGMFAGLPDFFNLTVLGPAPNATADWVRATTGTSYHVSAGCAVGSVVDAATFKVYGYDNLRVVDASVLPVLSQSAGMLSSVYLVAEFFAEKVIAEYNSMGNGDHNSTDATTTILTVMPTAAPKTTGPPKIATTTAPPTGIPTVAPSAAVTASGLASILLGLVISCAIM